VFSSEGKYLYDGDDTFKLSDDEPIFHLMPQLFAGTLEEETLNAWNGGIIDIRLGLCPNSEKLTKLFAMYNGVIQGDWAERVRVVVFYGAQLPPPHLLSHSSSAFPFSLVYCENLQSMHIELQASLEEEKKKLLLVSLHDVEELAIGLTVASGIVVHSVEQPLMTCKFHPKGCLYDVYVTTDSVALISMISSVWLENYPIFTRELDNSAPLVPVDLRHTGLTAKEQVLPIAPLCTTGMSEQSVRKLLERGAVYLDHSLSVNDIWHVINAKKSGVFIMKDRILKKSDLSDVSCPDCKKIVTQC
jgi:hypothetical protein